MSTTAMFCGRVPVANSTATRSPSADAEKAETAPGGSSGTSSRDPSARWRARSCELPSTLSVQMPTRPADTTAANCTTGFVPTPGTNLDTVAGVWTGYDSPYKWPASNLQGKPAGSFKSWQQVADEGRDVAGKETLGELAHH